MRLHEAPAISRCFYAEQNSSASDAEKQESWCLLPLSETMITECSAITTTASLVSFSAAAALKSSLLVWERTRITQMSALECLVFTRKHLASVFEVFVNKLTSEYVPVTEPCPKLWVQ